MCLIALAWQAHADYPLVVVANRDEYYARPAETAHFWPDKPYIFAGRDLEANGSWLGVTTTGRFAALTNYRDPQQNNPQAISRGALVSDFLDSGLSALQYATKVQQQAQAYNGFNLLLCDADSLVYCSNQIDQPSTLDPGIYAISNALLDTPWPKTESAREKLTHALDQPLPVQDLAQLLIDHSQAADDQLPQTGIPYQFEKALSSQFIQLDDYGTRCSAAFRVDQQGDAEFYERSFKPDQTEVHQKIPSFW